MRDHRVERTPPCSGGDQLLDALNHVAVLEEPVGRAPPNLVLVLGRPLVEMLPEQIGEEVVVAQAVERPIERHDEHRTTPQEVKLLLSARTGRHGVAQWRAEPRQHRGSHQELLRRRRLLLEHLLGQVVDQQAIRPGDLLDRCPRVAGALQRDREELQTSCPSVGPLDEHRAQVVLDGLPTDRPHQGESATLVECQIAPAQLDQCAPEPEIRQGQW